MMLAVWCGYLLLWGVGRATIALTLRPLVRFFRQLRDPDDNLRDDLHEPIEVWV